MARAIWSGSISFGMVTIPVKLFGATARRLTRPVRGVGPGRLDEPSQ